MSRCSSSAIPTALRRRSPPRRKSRTASESWCSTRPPGRTSSAEEALARLEELAQAGDWEGFAVTFFRDMLSVPVEELDALRATELWPPIIADAEASLGDLRALSRYDFQGRALS